MVLALLPFIELDLQKPNERIEMTKYAQGGMKFFKRSKEAKGE